MTARKLTAALHGKWHGGYGSCRCPAHPDRNPSLTIREGDRAPLLHCHRGCSRADVIAVLKARGLWENGRDPVPWRPPEHRQDDGAARTAAALAIWRTASPIGQTTAEAYLRSRGIGIQAPPTLRGHANLKHEPTGLWFPALVAAVQAPDRRVTAVHRTFLTPQGRKAQVSSPKMALGPLRAGAVRLGPAGPVLGLAEGIETALSALQLFDLSVWAALGSRLDRVTLPAEVGEVHLFGDNGEPGHEAAEKAAGVFTGQGRRVVLRFPPDGLGDWNDVLRREVAAA